MAAVISTLDMKSIFLFFIIMASLIPGPLCAEQIGPVSSGQGVKMCLSQGILTISSAYSPYSVHLIKAEVEGRIVRINAREGSILKAGTPLVEIDSTALKGQLEQLRRMLESLKKSEKVLTRDLALNQKKYHRYVVLQKKKHVEAQAVENVERELHNSELVLIENRRQQADVSRRIIELEDRISKCAPRFSRDFYVAENFKERYETVVPGENISRLLDISRAKIHLVLSPECFLKAENSLHEEGPVDFKIITEDGRSYSTRGRVEKLKIDPDNSYLYSYGFDLVFKPVEFLLWGQVVTVRLDLGQQTIKTMGSQGSSR